MRTVADHILGALLPRSADQPRLAQAQLTTGSWGKPLIQVDTATTITQPLHSPLINNSEILFLSLLEHSRFLKVVGAGTAIPFLA